MILADTSVWVDHFRRRNARLTELLENAAVLCHPFIVGELACGELDPRREILALLDRRPRAVVADHDEVLAFVESNRLIGSGIGWIDAHLLASAVLSDATIWTLDRRLQRIARTVGACG